MERPGATPDKDGWLADCADACGAAACGTRPVDRAARIPPGIRGERKMSGSSAPGNRLKIDVKELLAGLLLVVVAALFAASALRNLKLGTANAMGPGYFPVMISIPLAAIGLFIAGRAIGRSGEPTTLIRPLALLLVLAAPIAFAVTIAGLGFLPAVALTVLVAAWASRLMTVRTAATVTVVLAVLCVVIFYYLLRMPVQLVGPWLSGW
jgi:hypothetical protein